VVGIVAVIPALVCPSCIVDEAREVSDVRVPCCSRTGFFVSRIAYSNNLRCEAVNVTG